MMTSYDLERLEVWNNSRELVRDIYKLIIPALPEIEKYNLIAQMRRAAISIPSNIAEGYGRFYYQSNIHFCYIARGSLEELISQLVISYDLGYLSNDLFHQEMKRANGLVLLINGYISYLKKSKQGEHEPGFKYVSEQQFGYHVDTNNSNGSRFSDFDSQPSDFDSRTEGSKNAL